MSVKLRPFMGSTPRVWDSTEYDFSRQVAAWGSVPIVGKGTTSEEILTWSPEQVREVFEGRKAVSPDQESHKCGKFKQEFYTHRSTRSLIDFGCGSGYYAVELAKLGYRVALADIRQDNLDAAEWAMNAFGYAPTAKYLANEYGLGFVDSRVDIIHSVGVLHHTPHIRSILRKMLWYLNSGGEIWLMLYTGVLFKHRTNADPGKITSDITKHPQFEKFVEACDPVGFYADWYSRDKLEYILGDVFEIFLYEPLGDHKEIAIIKLRPIHG